ncbi:GcrA family cell cycle regulator [Amaricoccus tamworthensis]|uniref:GcrA family cell cycle regulator n=1 Tax=Amaricoccus tamworthensis TaxID=57002 RepID=UPI003C7CD24B
MSWTDERVETLKNMWAEGKSASQIAKELGGVTRNAVIGKVHRLGLSNRNAAPAAEPAAETAAPAAKPAAAAPKPAPERKEPPVAEKAAKPAPAPEPPRPQAAAPQAAPIPRPRPVPGQPLPPQPSGAEMSEEMIANLAEVAKKSRKLTLMQLTERTCKWPVGDPATEDFWFCGLPTTPGKPYCETHVGVAFQPMSARRDRRSNGGGGGSR